jgi:ATP-binding cassette subfamily B protein
MQGLVILQLLQHAGKSTLVKILLGLSRPTAGAIRVEGIDAADFAPESRRAVGTAIFQQYVRYPLTARENVGVGRVERLDDLSAITAAAQGAGAEFLAELPHGWDTVLWKEVKGGVDLSGGQWRRVATARALMRTLPASEPPPGPAAPDGGARPAPSAAPAAWLLVMDEPTAALDPVAEAAVFARFQEIAVGRTAVMVSHRLGSARLADRILVLADGRIVEEGSHQELLARGGLYARMFAMQAEWYAEGVPAAAG